MYTCIICHFTTEFDDVVVLGSQSGRCICLRCLLHNTKSERHMAAPLRRDVTAVLAELGV